VSGRLVLCADDFGLSRGISETIAALGAAGKLNATTCMTGCSGWARDADLLKALPEEFEIGIHLTLTGETPLTAMPVTAPDGTLPPINALARRARQRRLDLGEIAAEIAAQFDAFKAVIGRAPDFVDGHQHCHALPGIRDIVLDQTGKRAAAAWVRDCMDRPAAMLARPWRGKAFASAFHCFDLKDDAARRGLKCNASFAGHYGFAGDYAAIFPKFLRSPGQTHLVMCHPGAGRLDGDDIAEARLVEADALRRMDVAALAAQHGLSLVR
jgi:hypothetical protein